jgi:hypothetical protein
MTKMLNFPKYLLPARYVTPWVTHPVTVSQRRSKLKIIFNDGTFYSWDGEVEHNESLVNPFRHFYKWYFTKDTPHYTMKYDTGELTFLRANIKTFSVNEEGI